MASNTDGTLRLRRGRQLGKYRLLERLADTSMSQVWKARDTVEGRLVALKIPYPCRPGSAEEEELLDEIRLAARLEHPNILRISNADRIGNLYVIATDLALESLEDRLRRRLSTEKALSYMRQTLEGLAFAHRNRIIHRDIKPSNIMIFPGDRVRITDFGIAKVAKSTMISATGSGTLLYFAPEQAHGYPCFASDVFSLGLIFHQMLTGKLPRWPFEWPFEGDEILRSKVPPEFCRFLRKATQYDHKQRFHDAGEMLAAFERLEPAVRKFLKPRSRRRRRPRRLGAWKELRFREFERAFRKRLFLDFQCPGCGGPISEHMRACPWCGLEDIRFGEESAFPCYCERCKRGLRNEWRYCPWCWGPGFNGASGEPRSDPRYRSKCRNCSKPLIEGMRYCPWCHAKCPERVAIEELRGRCPHCRSSVAADFWEFCPWCAKPLKETRRRSHS